MIAFGTSQQGALHQRLNMDCQDNYRVKSIGKYQVAVIADGLGSAVYSGAASSLACDSVINTLQELLSETDVFSDTVEIIKTGFCIACARVLELADSKKLQTEHFETTLSVIIADDNEISYGQIGDGGISVLASDGCMRLITLRQNGSMEGSVYPLLSQFNRCVFGRIKTKWSVIMMATDGMLNFFSSVQDKDRLRNYISSFFMPAFGENQAVRRKLENNLESAMEDETLLESVDDDRTLVFVINEKNQPEQNFRIDFTDNPNQQGFAFEGGKMVLPSYFKETCQRFYLNPTRFYRHTSALTYRSAPVKKNAPDQVQPIYSDRIESEAYVSENRSIPIDIPPASDHSGRVMSASSANTVSNNSVQEEGASKSGILVFLLMIAGIIIVGLIAVWMFTSKKSNPSNNQAQPLTPPDSSSQSVTPTDNASSSDHSKPPSRKTESNKHNKP